MKGEKKRDAKAKDKNRGNEQLGKMGGLGGPNKRVKH